MEMNLLIAYVGLSLIHISSFRGVVDKRFFLYKLAKVYA